MAIESSAVLTGLSALLNSGLDKSPVISDSVAPLSGLTELLNNPQLAAEAGEFGNTLLQQLQSLTQSVAPTTTPANDVTIKAEQAFVPSLAQLSTLDKGLLEQFKLDLAQLPQQMTDSSMAENLGQLMNQPDGLQELSAFFGKQLPVAKKPVKEINLDETLQALSEVLGRIQHTVVEQTEPSAVSVESASLLEQVETNSETNSESNASSQVAQELIGALADSVNSLAPTTTLQVQDQPATATAVSNDAPKPDHQPDNAASDTQQSNTQPVQSAVALSLAQNPAPNFTQSAMPVDAESANSRVTNAKSKAATAADSRASSPPLVAWTANNPTAQNQPFAESAADLNEFLKGKAFASATDSSGQISGLSEQIADQSILSGALEQNTDSHANNLTGDLQSLGRQLNMPEKVELPPMTKHVYSSEWNQELGSKILWMNNQNISSAELKLNPEHLGPISIRIEMQQEQANISFTSHNAGVREMLEASIPKLREMMGSQQITLADVNVSQQSFSGQGQAQNPLYQQSEQHSQRQPGAESENTGDNAGLLEAGTHPLSDEIEQSRALVTNGLMSVYA